MARRSEVRRANRVTLGSISVLSTCLVLCGVWCVFFFQAEDGIRDYKVTGVQTCALPIWEQRSQWSPPQIGFANQLPHNLRDQFLHRVAERLNLGHGGINVGRDPQTLELRMHDPHREDP